MVISSRTAGRPAVRSLTGLTRRSLMAGAAALSCGSATPARAETMRIAAIDWAMLETTLALGLTPVAGAELVMFRKAAVEPAVPDSVADLGLRGSISYEQLYATRPDLVLISPWYESRRAALTRIAPVESLSIHEAGRPPYEPAVAAARTLGRLLGRQAEAETAVAEAEAALAAARASLARLSGRSVLIMNLADARHFRAFGADSMFGDVAERLGLKLAWAAPTRFGAYPTVGVEALADMPDAIALNVGPTPPSALAEMTASRLWRAMPPIAAGRFAPIAPVNPYGGLPAATRFARLAAQALAGLPDA